MQDLPTAGSAGDGTRSAPSSEPPSTWREMEEFLSQIPATTCGGQQPEFLYRLAAGTSGKGTIVEIGTYIGKSTIALAFAQKERGGRPITTIDPFEHPQIQANLHAAGVEQFVDRRVERSSIFAKEWREPIELLWIDGDHSYAGADLDLRKWSPFVVPGGVLALHDYPGHLDSLQVWKAVHQRLLAEPRRWRVIADRDPGSIIAFQRLPESTVTPSLSSRLYWARRNLETYAKELLERIRPR